ncbi:MAG: hypothetical protein AAF193_07920 [Bacteroidota bacterium]
MEEQKKHFAILESTSPTGKQALEVIDHYKSIFQVEVLTSEDQGDALIEQALKFNPNTVVIEDEDQFEKVRDALWDEGINTYCGIESLKDVVEMQDVHQVINALSGTKAITPTLSALKAGKSVALSSHAPMMIAGEIISQTALNAGAEIFPLQPGVSAIQQCKTGERHVTITEVAIMTTGGILQQELEAITKEHFNSKAGGTVSETELVNRSSLMEVGMNLISSRLLFGFKPDQLTAIYHPQNEVDAIVKFGDGNSKWCSSNSDSNSHLIYAMAAPLRLPNPKEPSNYAWNKMEFEALKPSEHPLLDLVFTAMEEGGNAPARLFKANEIGVSQFLEGDCSYEEMLQNIIKEFHAGQHIAKPSLEELINL